MGKEWPVAKEDGEYVVDGAYYAMRKGEKYPPEAEIVGTQDAPDEERAKGEAPKNRAKPAAPENRGA